MRAVRQAAQLGFQVEARTKRAISETFPSFRKVAMERIASELMKLLGAPRPSIGLNLMSDTGLLKEVFADWSTLQIDTEEIDVVGGLGNCGRVGRRRSRSATRGRPVSRCISVFGRGAAQRTCAASRCQTPCVSAYYGPAPPWGTSRVKLSRGHGNQDRCVGYFQSSGARLF